MDFTTKGNIYHPETYISLYVELESKMKEGEHSSFRLFVVESGSIILQLQGQKLFVEGPALLCVNNEESITQIETSSLSMAAIYFTPVIINSRFGDKPLSKEIRSTFTHTESQDYLWLMPFMNTNLHDRYIKLGPSMSKRILNLVSSLSDELRIQTDLFWPCRSRAYFLEILYALNNIQRKYDGFKHNLDTDTKPIEPILLYLHSHYSKAITLEYLVEKFGVNRTKLNRLFVEVTGDSVINYLISLRVKLASLILRDTLRPVKEIAYQTGFSDISHFGRTFKQHMKISPSKYREEYNWMMQ